MLVSLSLLQQMWRKATAIVMFAVLMTAANFVFLGFSSDAAPSYASSSDRTEAAIERAYDESEAAGIQEEIYQQRLQEGQNPEKMPKPYKRIVDAQGKEVPETSFVEKSVSKVQQLTKKIAGE